MFLLGQVAVVTDSSLHPCHGDAGRDKADSAMLDCIKLMLLEKVVIESCRSPDSKGSKVDFEVVGVIGCKG